MFGELNMFDGALSVFIGERCFAQKPFTDERNRWSMQVCRELENEKPAGGHWEQTQTLPSGF